MVKINVDGKSSVKEREKMRKIKKGRCRRKRQERMIIVVSGVWFMRQKPAAMQGREETDRDAPH